MDTALPAIYPLSLHDALPIWVADPADRPAAARRESTLDRRGHALYRRAPGFLSGRARPPAPGRPRPRRVRSEEHTSELQSPDHLVCRHLLEKKKQSTTYFERK